MSKQLQTASPAIGVSRPRTMRQTVLDAMADWITSDKIAVVTGFELKTIWKILTAKDLQNRIERRREDGQRLEFRHKPTENPRSERITDAKGDVWIASRCGAAKIGCRRRVLLHFEKGCRFLDNGKKLRYWEPPGQIGHYHREIDIQKIAALWKGGLSTAHLKYLGKKQKNGFLKVDHFAKKRTADGKIQVYCTCMRCKRPKLFLISLTRFRHEVVRSCGCLRREQAPVNSKSGHARLIKAMTADKTKSFNGQRYVALRVAMRILGVKDGATVRSWAIHCPFLFGAGIGTHVFTDYFGREIDYYLKADLKKAVKNREAMPATPPYDGLRSLSIVRSLLGLSSNQLWYDMKAIRRKAVRKPGKKKNNTSGRRAYITNETYDLLCERRRIITPTGAVADLPLAADTTDHGNGSGQNANSSNRHIVPYPELGIQVDFARHVIVSSNSEIEFNGRVEWHFLTVALKMHPDTYSLGQLEAGYPGAFNKGARAVAKLALNKKLKPLKIALHEYKIIRIGNITV